MVFPNLKKLRWSDAEDDHGLSCFEGDGLAWALDANQTPKLVDIEAPDAGGDQLCSESLDDALLSKTLERLRIRDCYEEEFAVRIRNLELVYVDDDVDYRAMAGDNSVTICNVKEDGTLSLVGSPSYTPVQKA